MTVMTYVNELAKGPKSSKSQRFDAAAIARAPASRMTSIN